MCGVLPKNGRFDFCGLQCRIDARKSAPRLLSVHRGHITFMIGGFMQTASSRIIMTVYS
jgi:hypothetical protein